MTSFKLIFFLAVLLPAMAFRAAAQSPSESEHLHRVIVSLQLQDSMAYAQLFPSADTMTAVTLRKAPMSSTEYEKARMMRENPMFLANQDTLISSQACAVFNAFVKEGEKLRINWHDCLLLRYELEALGKTSNPVADAIVPERYVGFVFINDARSGKHFAFTITDVMKIDNKWYGGALNYLFEAENKDQVKMQIREAHKRELKGIPDEADSTAKAASAKEDGDEDDDNTVRKQVVDRKLYTGMLDEEIPVVLYIRSLKGDCPEAACSWEALFRFGDQDEYTRPVVSRDEKGRWIFTEEETGAVMELSLKSGIYTGTFSATTDKVDYEASLKETALTAKKTASLEAIMDQNKQR